jgi:hypothetical protein
VPAIPAASIAGAHTRRRKFATSNGPGSLWPGHLRDVVKTKRLSIRGGTSSSAASAAVGKRNLATGALSVADREAILRALAAAPGGELAELRGVLLVEHDWRVREGLV